MFGLEFKLQLQIIHYSFTFDINLYDIPKDQSYST